MDEKEFLEQFKKNNEKDHKTVLELQEAYNNINISVLAKAYDEKKATEKIIEILKEKVPNARAKDITDFFLTLEQVSK